MVEMLSLNKVNMHGCAVGLVAENGKPIQKAWTIATMSPAVFDEPSKFICPGPHVHPEHHPCAGKETK
eukprot:70472-Heterocapsa_arctica.AAC.1